MLFGCIKGAVSAIYSILYAARAQYGIYCLVAMPVCRYTARRAKYWPILLATYSMCDLYLPRPKNGGGMDRAVYEYE